MKKTVPVAGFTKQFGPLTNDLPAGELVEVTSYGQLHGRYVRDGRVRSDEAPSAALDHRLAGPAG